jgi:hypothetical protein
LHTRTRTHTDNFIHKHAALSTSARNSEPDENNSGTPSSAAAAAAAAAAAVLAAVAAVPAVAAAAAAAAFLFASANTLSKFLASVVLPVQLSLLIQQEAKWQTYL